MTNSIAPRDPIDLPIIMSAPMVRASWDGSKTMTRRVAYMTRRGFSPAKNPLVDGPWTKVRPGDRLWVREAWAPHSTYDHLSPREMPKSNVFYLADGGYSPSGSRGRPSIHMPRWASRLTLIVEAVKREPLQAISIADTIAEGIPATAPIGAFADLWRGLHGPKSWDENPEVICISFRAVKKSIDAIEVAA